MEGLGFVRLREVLVRPCRCLLSRSVTHTTLTSKPKWKRLGLRGEGEKRVRREEEGKGSKEKIEMALRFSVSLSFSSGVSAALSIAFASKSPGILGVFRVRPLIVV